MSSWMDVVTEEDYVAAIDDLYRESYVKDSARESNQRNEQMTQVSGYVFDKAGGIPQEALKQDQIWYDGKGIEHRIAEMNPSHAYFAGRKLGKAWGQHGTHSALGKALRLRAGSFRPHSERPDPTQ